MQEPRKIDESIREQITGHVLVHNGVEMGYPFTAAIESLTPLCSEILVCNAESTDCTGSILDEISALMPDNCKLTIFEAPWEVEEDHVMDGHKAVSYARLARLTNECIDNARTPWHLQLQADELLHERGVGSIAQQFAVMAPFVDGFLFRRLTFHGGTKRYIPEAGIHQPISARVIRLGRVGATHSVGDAESITCKKWQRMTNEPHTSIYHYAYCRPPLKQLDKSVAMHAMWGFPDERILALRDRREWDYQSFIRDDELREFRGVHPQAILPFLDAEGYVDGSRVFGDQ